MPFGLILLPCVGLDDGAALETLHIRCVVATFIVRVLLYLREVCCRTAELHCFVASHANDTIALRHCMRLASYAHRQRRNLGLYAHARCHNTRLGDASETQSSETAQFCAALESPLGSEVASVLACSSALSPRCDWIHRRCHTKLHGPRYPCYGTGVSRRPF